MIRVIGAPFDYSGRCEGSRMGPAALRLAGLVDELASIAGEVYDAGDLDVSHIKSSGDGFTRFEPYLELVRSLKTETLQTLNNGDMAMTLGGDHSIALGSISAALEYSKGDLAVLWIDAHADVNSPDQSVSGNLHGMPVAALMGAAAQGDSNRSHQWAKLLREIVPPTRLSCPNIAWLGLRDVDPAECQVLRTQNPGYVATMHEFDRFGVVQMMAKLEKWLRDCGAKHLWISFDVDCLDPVLAPGTGTAVRGGFTYREAHLIAELLRENLDLQGCPYRLIGLDVVETNPVLDTNNITAVTAVEWTVSLFGKTILGKR